MSFVDMEKRVEELEATVSYLLHKTEFFERKHGKYIANSLDAILVCDKMLVWTHLVRFKSIYSLNLIQRVLKCVLTFYYKL